MMLLVFHSLVYVDITWNTNLTVSDHAEKAKPETMQYIFFVWPSYAFLNPAPCLG